MAFGCPQALVMTELKSTEYFLCCIFCQLFVFFVVVLLNVWAACSYTGSGHCVGQYMPFATQWLLHRVAGYYGQAATIVSTRRMVWAASYYIGYIASYYGLLLHSDGMGELEGNECAFFTAPLLMRYKGQRPTPCLVPVLNTLQDILVVFVLEYTCCFVLFNK